MRPLILADATISLYVADENGDANLDLPVWLGACAEGLNLDRTFEKVESTQTGNDVRQFETNGQLHDIKIERIWMANGDPFRPFQPVRGQRLVLNICWEDAVTAQSYQRTYYGVQAQEDSVASQGIMQSIESQHFWAERMVEG
jgi:hypothetical protein